MGVPLLDMESISKAFPGVQALANVSFDVCPGEVHVLVGENGAGKSTLMKILSGVYGRDSGEIRLEGQPVRLANPRQAQELGVSIIYQEFNLLPHLSIAQNIFITREPRKFGRFFVDDTRLNAAAEQILSDLNLTMEPDELVARLTVAEQQMVEIAKALSFDAKILVMDEPTAALSETEINELFRVVRRLRDRGVGIIYISHRLQELKQIADRVTVLRDGTKVGTVRWEDITIDDLIRMMVGREVSDVFPERSTAPTEPLLTVRSLKREGVLHDISFTLHRGEVLGVSGLVGAGRTEMARAVFGADRPDAGEVRVNGEPVMIRNPGDAIDAGIAYLSEDRKRDGLALNLTLEENVVLASIPRFTDRLGLVQRRRAEERASELVESLRIKTPSMQQIVRYLSGGNQQKVVLAKWLCREAEIVIFDEPTRGIDVGAKREVYNLINQLSENGVGVIMISSELPEIIGMSDRVLVMRDGRLVGEFARQEASEEKIMYLATGGR